MESTTHPGPYTVKLPLFEGPLDLLLHLIQKNELDITVISLAMVADQFVEYLRSMEEVQPDVIADFLVVAARLLLIKSRWLLPRPAVVEDDDEEDLGEALARRLREYKRFKDAAEWLRQVEAGGMRGYVRIAPPPKLETRLDPEGMSIDDLISVLQEMLAEEPVVESVDPVVAPRKVTVSEKIELIQDLVSRGRPVSFARLIGQGGSRLEIVVSLWAVLELIKRGRLRARQTELFGEIILLETGQAVEEA